MLAAAVADAWSTYLYWLPCWGSMPDSDPVGVVSTDQVLRSPRAANTTMASLMEQLRGRRDRRAQTAHDGAATELRPADPDLSPPG